MTGGELGHNLMDHHNGGGATATPGLLDRYYKGTTLDPACTSRVFVTS
jgi:hypothetical protein